MLNIMNFVNRYIYLLDDETTTGNIGDVKSLCTSLNPILRLVGFVMLCIKIVVPIILIVIGMIELAKSVGDADEVSKATKKLVQKLIMAVLVFLVTTIVTLVMTLIGGTQYTDCLTCIKDPFGPTCKNGVGY